MAQITFEETALDRRAELLDKPAAEPSITPDQVIKKLNKKYAVVQHGNRMLVMCQTHDPVLNRPTLAFLGASDFRLKFQNKYVLVQTVNKEGKPEQKWVTWASLWLGSPKRREYDGLAFTPGKTPRGYFNIWRGLVVKPKTGCCDRIVQHMFEVICAGDQQKFKYLWRWFAHAIQHTDELPETAIVLRSKQGTGKNTLIDAFGAIFGRHYMPLTQAGLLCGRFTAHLMDAVVVFANEAVWGGDKQGEGRLKSMITDPVETIEGKGRDAVTVPNFKRVIVASNESWAVPRGIDDRRFFCLDVSDQRVGDSAYFTALHTEIANGGIAAWLQELLNTDLTDWHPRHSMPTGNADGEDMKIEGMGSTLKFWLECLMFGYTVPPTMINSDPDQTGSSDDRWQQSVDCEIFYNMYSDWCQRHGLRPDTVVHFGRNLRQAVTLQKGRFRVSGNRQYCYVFPTLEAAKAEFRDKIASIDFDDE